MMRHKLSRGNSKGKQQGGGKLEPGKQQMKSSSSSRRRESHLGKAWMGKREAHLGSLVTSIRRPTTLKNTSFGIAHFCAQQVRLGQVTTTGYDPKTLLGNCGKLQNPKKRVLKTPLHSRARPRGPIGFLNVKKVVKVDTYDKESDHSYKAVRTCPQKSDGQ